MKWNIFSCHRAVAYAWLRDMKADPKNIEILKNSLKFEKGIEKIKSAMKNAKGIASKMDPDFLISLMKKEL